MSTFNSCRDLKKIQTSQITDYDFNLIAINSFFLKIAVINNVNTTGEIIQNHNSQTTVFAHNLFDPNKSGKSIGGFFIQGGLLSFYKYDDVSDDEPILNFKRVGAVVSYQVNNIVWTKDDTCSRVLIGSFKALMTYRLLSLRMQNGNKDPVYLTLFGGYSSRVLGGDLGMEKYDYLVEKFTAFLETKYSTFEWEQDWILEIYMGYLVVHISTAQ